CCPGPARGRAPGGRRADAREAAHGRPPPVRPAGRGAHLVQPPWHFAGFAAIWHRGRMPTRLVPLVLDANDPPRLARFWAGALGWEVGEESADEIDVSPPGFDYPGPAALPLVFVPVPEPKTGQNRVIPARAAPPPSHQPGRSP